MIKELHGKRYYVDLGEDRQIVLKAHDFRKTLNSLQDEIFSIKKLENGHWIMYSESGLETFRGKKYSDWEKFKRYVYKLKRA